MNIIKNIDLKPLLRSPNVLILLKKKKHAYQKLNFLFLNSKIVLKSHGFSCFFSEKSLSLEALVSISKIDKFLAIY